MRQARVTLRGMVVVLAIAAAAGSMSSAFADESDQSSPQKGRMVLGEGHGCNQDLGYPDGQPIKVNLVDPPARYVLIGTEDATGMGADFDIVFLDTAGEQIEDPEANADARANPQRGIVPRGAETARVCLFDTASSEWLAGHRSPIPATFSYQEFSQEVSE